MVKDIFKFLRKIDLVFLVYVVFWSIFLFWLFTRVYIVKSGDWYSTGGTWGDLPLHFTIIQHFLDKGFFNLDYPLLIGTKMSYPFLMDWMSALFIRIGFSEYFSIVYLQWSILVTALIFMYKWMQKYLDSGIWVFIVSLVFLLTGVVKPNWFMNVLTTHMLPQRGFVLGFMLFNIFMWLWTAKRLKNRFVLIGLIFILMPIAHVQTYIFIVGILVVTLLLNIKDKKSFDWRNWLWGVAGFIISVGIFIWQYLANSGLNHKVVEYGYLDGINFQKDDLMIWNNSWKNIEVTKLDKISMFGLFGIVVVMTIIGLVFLFVKSRKSFNQLINPMVFRLLVSSLICLTLIIVCMNSSYIFIHLHKLFLLILDFNPFASKFFIYVYLLLIFVSVYIISLYFKNIDLIQRKYRLIYFYPVYILGLMFLVILCMNIKLISKETQDNYLLFKNQDRVEVRELKKNIDINSNVLAVPRHNNPAQMFIGNNHIYGYPGWIYSYGYNPGKLGIDLGHLFNRSRDVDFGIIEKYGIDYLIIDSSVNNNDVLNIDMEMLVENYPLIKQVGDWQLYKLR